MFDLDRFFNRPKESKENLKKTQLSEELSREEKIRIISEAKNFPALKRAIDEIGEIGDGKGVIYPPDKLKARIDDLERALRDKPRIQGKIDVMLMAIPEIYGIRNIVREIAEGITLL